MRFIGLRGPLRRVESSRRAVMRTDLSSLLGRQSSLSSHMIRKDRKRWLTISSRFIHEKKKEQILCDLQVAGGARDLEKRRNI